MILGLNLLLLGGGVALTLEYLHKRERSVRGVLAGTKSSEDARAVEGQGESLTELLIDAGTGRPAAPLDAGALGGPEGAPSQDADRQPAGGQDQERNPPATPASSAGRADGGPTRSSPTDSGRGSSSPPARAPDAGLTSRPRKLVDAGGGASAPGPEEDARRVSVLAAQISLVVERHQGQLKRCYESASKVTTPEQPIEGRIDVRFSVQADGSAQSVRTSRNETGSAALENCLLALVRSWTFPATEGEALDFVWPFEFQAPK